MNWPATWPSWSVKGFNPLRQRVDMQAKLSFPFVCLIMALIGIPLSMFKEKGRFLPAAVLIGLGWPCSTGWGSAT